MKNKLLKYYIAAFYLGSTLVMLAQQPGDDTGDGSLEDNDPPAAAPIDDYVWVLALIALVFVFIKLRAIQNKKMRN